MLCLSKVAFITPYFACNSVADNGHWWWKPEQAGTTQYLLRCAPTLGKYVFSIFSLFAYIPQTTTKLYRVRVVGPCIAVSNVPQTGECILGHTALPTTKPSGHYATSLPSLVKNQNSNQDSSLSFPLLAPERATHHEPPDVSPSLPFPSLLVFK